MVMSEEISRLMDGELDDERVEGVCAQMRHRDAMADWVTYHVIGDALRGTAHAPAKGFGDRFAARLAAEPFVIGPRGLKPRPLTFAWAAAATIAAVSLVGWVAVSTVDTQTAAVARAREAVGVRAAALRPQAIPTDYLLAHQEYSPTVPIQGLGLGLRNAAAESRR
jgi:sigma-E factor negative regulatory protein RseA